MIEARIVVALCFIYGVEWKVFFFQWFKRDLNLEI